MTNTQFISRLKKALAGLDKASKNDILQEIKSHAAESGAPLIDQFGSAEELAKQYLDGEKIAKPITTLIWGMSKSLFKLIGMLVVASIILIALLTYFFTKDKFNYANVNAVELSGNSADWQSRAWVTDLKLQSEKASLVLYWHDDASVRWNCKGSSPKTESGNTLVFGKSHCLVYLPKVTTTLNAERSKVVLVKPQVSLAIEAVQSAIKIAENGEKYKYELDKSRTKFSDLISSDIANYTIQLKATESSISAYEY